MTAEERRVITEALARRRARLLVGMPLDDVTALWQAEAGMTMDVLVQRMLRAFPRRTESVKGQ